MSSRKLPVCPKATVASLPTTLATTIVRLSTMTGFTLPGMMLEPGCVSGRASSPIPARGPIPISRTSEAIFHRLSAIVRMAPWAAMAASSVACAWKWFAALADGQPGQARQPGARPERVFGMGVDPGPDRGPAERDLEQLGLGRACAPDRLLDLAGIAAELLAEADRCRVLEMGPAGLDDRPERLLLGHQRGVEVLEGGQQVLLDGHRGRQLERRRDDVVRALAAVDLVVGVDLSALAQAARGQVGDDLVHVRVGRGRRAGLEDVDRELLVVVAIGDRCRSRGDRSRDVRRRAARVRRWSAPPRA